MLRKVMKFQVNAINLSNDMKFFMRGAMIRPSGPDRV